MADDLRFVPKVLSWESPVSVLVEPEYNLYQNFSKVLKRQIDDAVLGYSAVSLTAGILCDRTGSRLIAGTKEFLRERLAGGDAYDEIVPGLYREFIEGKVAGVSYATDTVVERRFTALRKDDRFCQWSNDSEE